MNSQVEGSLGWEADPPDEDILRARTKLGRLRIWHLPRTGLPQINGKDFAGTLAHRDLYILVNDSTKEAYTGESSYLRKRLSDYDKSSSEELKDSSSMLVIGDGRGHYQSMFTESTLRPYFEKVAIKQISSAGILRPVNKMKEEPKMSVAVQTVAQRLEDELQFVFAKLGIALPVVGDRRFNSIALGMLDNCS